MGRAWRRDWLVLDGSLKHKYARHRRMLETKLKKRGFTAFFHSFRNLRPQVRMHLSLWVCQHVERPLSVRLGSVDGIDFSTFDDHDFAAIFRLQSLAQLQAVARSLGLVDSIGKNGYRADPVSAFAVLLARLSYPKRFAAELHRVLHLNWSSGKLSSIFNAVLDFLYARFRRLIRFDHRWFSRANCIMFADAIHAAGAPLRRCVGFIDGVTYGICKPKHNQRCMYSGGTAVNDLCAWPFMPSSAGHKKHHLYNEQGLVIPNGLIISMWGPWKGASNDKEMLNRSRLHEQLDRRLPPGAYVFGDKGKPSALHRVFAHSAVGYSGKPRVQTPIKEGANPAPNVLQFNGAMSAVRVSVEW